MKSLITIFTTSLLLSTASFAGSVTQEGSTDLATATYQSKAEAYDAGFKMIENLKTLSSDELIKKLPFYVQASADDVMLKDTKVTITEFATSPSEINYQAIVNVDYNFSAYQQDED
ncbi:DUF3316 domain-containing protein [Vibrio sp. RC27]